MKLGNGVERAQTQVARGLQRLEQRRESCLTELVGILRELLHLLGLWQDVIALADVFL